MTNNDPYVGTAVTLFTDFTKTDGTPEDPDVVTITIRRPDGTTFPTVIPASTTTGHWTATFLPDQPGLWTYRWSGTGGLTAADEGTLRIRPSLILSPPSPPLLGNIDTVFRRLKMTDDDPFADDLVELQAAVSAEVRRITRRGFEGAETTYTETVRMRLGNNTFMLAHVPVTEITGIMRKFFDGTDAFAYETGDWRIDDPDVGLVTLWPRSSWGYNPRAWDTAYFGQGPNNITYADVTYKVSGEIPEDINRAVEDWIATRWTERVSQGLLHYSTGSDSETYDKTNIGKPPLDVTRTMMSYFHTNTGGPI